MGNILLLLPKDDDKENLFYPDGWNFKIETVIKVFNDNFLYAYY